MKVLALATLLVAASGFTAEIIAPDAVPPEQTDVNDNLTQTQAVPYYENGEFKGYQTIDLRDSGTQVPPTTTPRPQQLEISRPCSQVWILWPPQTAQGPPPQPGLHPEGPMSAQVQEESQFPTQGEPPDLFPLQSSNDSICPAFVQGAGPPIAP